MNDNGKANHTKGINCDLERKDTSTSINQLVTGKIHITKHKGEILKEIVICYRKGGINGIEDGSLNELAEILYNTFSFDYQGSTGNKTSKKESILRALKHCEQDEKEYER